MAAKKRAKKAPRKKQAAARKPTPKKKSGAKKTGAKKAGGRRATPAKKAPAKRKPAAKSTATRSAPAEKPARSAKPHKKSKRKVSSMQVNLGHVFSLRPRVSTTFRQPDFLTARHFLRDESYASIEEAARAVAEKALEMTHEGPSKLGFRPGR